MLGTGTGATSVFPALITFASKARDSGLLAEALPAQFPEMSSEKWVKDVAEGISCSKISRDVVSTT